MSRRPRPRRIKLERQVVHLHVERSDWRRWCHDAENALACLLEWVGRQYGQPAREQAQHVVMGAPREPDFMRAAVGEGEG